MRSNTRVPMSPEAKAPDVTPTFLAMFPNLEPTTLEASSTPPFSRADLMACWVPTENSSLKALRRGPRCFMAIILRTVEPAIYGRASALLKVRPSCSASLAIAPVSCRPIAAVPNAGPTPGTA